MFGEEASNAVVVNYAYELVMNPSENADLDEVIGVMDRMVVQSLLPTLFGDKCSEAPSRRLLQNATSYDPVGMSTNGRGLPMDGGKKCE